MVVHRDLRKVYDLDGKREKEDPSGRGNSMRNCVKKVCVWGLGGRWDGKGATGAAV